MNAEPSVPDVLLERYRLNELARDEALLHSASDRGVASLRFYTWTEPTLSLGYFQPTAACRLA